MEYSSKQETTCTVIDLVKLQLEHAEEMGDGEQVTKAKIALTEFMQELNR